ncbi:MAG: prohibitin family protein [Candidatus Dadabacteria bacterium]|nr:MAG: prohibitin family protein [Candidatus Dadabacteria bacterium]
MNDIFDRIAAASDNGGPSLAPVLAGGAIVLAVLIFLASTAFVIVHPGTVGVVTHFGAVQSEVLPEGLHLVMPIKTKVIPVDVRVQKVETEASASSKDLQIVTSRVVLNYYVDKDHAAQVFQELGPGFQRTIVEPAIQESVKSATALFNAEQLITERPVVKEAIFEDIRKRLGKYNLIVTDFSIIDFAFSPEFNKAIEEKQVAEQRALRAKNDLQRIKIEAEQVRARAQGEAEARLVQAKAEAESQRLLRQTLNRDLVQLRAIEKWDGKLPQYTGAGMPFLNLGAGGK